MTMPRKDRDGPSTATQVQTSTETTITIMNTTDKDTPIQRQTPPEPPVTLRNNREDVSPANTTVRCENIPKANSSIPHTNSQTNFIVATGYESVPDAAQRGQERKRKLTGIEIHPPAKRQLQTARKHTAPLNPRKHRKEFRAAVQQQKHFKKLQPNVHVSRGKPCSSLFRTNTTDKRSV